MEDKKVNSEISYIGKLLFGQYNSFRRRFVHNWIIHPICSLLPEHSANKLHDRNADWAFGEETREKDIDVEYWVEMYEGVYVASICINKYLHLYISRCKDESFSIHSFIDEENGLLYHVELTIGERLIKLGYDTRQKWTEVLRALELIVEEWNTLKEDVDEIDNEEQTQA